MLLKLLCLILSSAFASSTATKKPQASLNLKEFSESKAWRRILYYEDGSPEVDDPTFYLSKADPWTPMAEAEAAYKGMILNEQPLGDDHPICKFPARFYLLTKHLKQLHLRAKYQHCKEMSEFVGRLNGVSASIVFSSYYLNNPSSAFGHTFLKINKNQEKELDLLNYGIGYAAVPDTNNMLLYAFKGLGGLFKGEFTAVPYYYKVREYNDFESRDLWEYQLSLNPQEVLFLNLHTWELGRAWSWYLYLSKNCAYWSIRVIEAVRPNIDIKRHFAGGFLTPANTVKSLFQEKGLVSEVRYRPSLYQRLLASLEGVESKEVKKLNQLVQDVVTKKISQQDLASYAAKTLDQLILLHDYQFADDYVKDEVKILKQKKPLLVARSQKKVLPYTEPIVPKNLAPHFSHNPRRVSLSTRKWKRYNSELLIKYKHGFHELLDPYPGFNPNMSLNYLDFSAQLRKTHEDKKWDLNVDHVYLIHINAFNPVTTITSDWSWRVNFGLDSEQAFLDSDQKLLFGYVDGGFAINSFWTKDFLFYGMFRQQIELGGGLDQNFRIALSPIAGLKWHITPHSALQAEVRPTWFIDFENSELFVLQSVLKAQHRITQESPFSLYLQSQWNDSEDVSTWLGEVGLHAFF